MTRLMRSVEKEEFWRLVVDEHAASGLSIRKFCEREAVAEASFYFWRKELARRDTEVFSGQEPPAMVLVEVVDPSPMPRKREANADGDRGDTANVMQAPLVEVTVAGGFVMRAPAAIDADQLATWLGEIAKVAAS